MKRIVSVFVLTLVTSAAFACDSPFVSYGWPASDGPFGNPDLGGLEYPVTLVAPTVQSHGGPVAGNAGFADAGKFRNDGSFGNPDLDGLQYPVTLVAPTVESHV